MPAELQFWWNVGLAITSSIVGWFVNQVRQDLHEQRKHMAELTAKVHAVEMLVTDQKLFTLTVGQLA